MVLQVVSFVGKYWILLLITIFSWFIGKGVVDFIEIYVPNFSWFVYLIIGFVGFIFIASFGARM